jgi:ureidoglycolate hydrolase
MAQDAAAPAVVDVELEPLTAEAFSAFGACGKQPLRSPDWVAAGTRTGPGVREAKDGSGQRVAHLWRLGDLRFEAGVPYLGFVRYWRQGFVVSQLERHLRETQTWIATSGSGALLVAEPSSRDDAAPAPATVHAFLIEPGDAVSIAKGIWMVHFFPFGRHADYLVVTARRDPEEDRQTVDLAETHGATVAIRLPARVAGAEDE